MEKISVESKAKALAIKIIAQLQRCYLYPGTVIVARTGDDVPVVKATCALLNGHPGIAHASYSRLSEFEMKVHDCPCCTCFNGLSFKIEASPDGSEIPNLD